MRARSITLMFILGMLALVWSCASNGVKSLDNIARAQAAVEAAQTAGGWTYAPLEMKTAQDKLAEARREADRDEGVRASRLADQAALDARLAQKKADAEKARRAAAEMRDTLNALKQAAGSPASPAP